jgi:thiamine-monophosphate kinase
MPGEFDFIQWIKTRQCPTALTMVPAGDDMAVLRWAENDLLLVGVDQVLDGVHFDSAVHGPRDIGRKVMNRNLSDCAAMGCLPAAAVATVALRHGISLDYARELYLGLCDAGDPFDCRIVGGDTASWPGKLVLTVTILGRSGGIQPVLRSGAKPDDGIYVTGPLGGSILGRHMTFAPRVVEGRRLAESGVVTSMIDLSDGLSRDLGHICRESGVGAMVEASAIPLHGDAVRLAVTSGREPIEHAVNDGEDYELLFTANSQPPLGVRIGTITTGSEILLRQGAVARRLEPRGWEHKI